MTDGRESRVTLSSLCRWCPVIVFANIGAGDIGKLCFLRLCLVYLINFSSASVKTRRWILERKTNWASQWDSNRMMQYKRIINRTANLKTKKSKRNQSPRAKVALSHRRHSASARFSIRGQWKNFEQSVGWGWRRSRRKKRRVKLRRWQQQLWILRPSRSFVERKKRRGPARRLLRLRPDFLVYSASIARFSLLSSEARV